jgi:hypothetical protein
MNAKTRDYRWMVGVVLVLVWSAAAKAQPGLLTGDPKLACEALACLSTGSPPHECQPAIARYLSINAKKPAQTVAARMAFLNQCPMVTPPGSGGQGGSSSEASNGKFSR